ncbi:hypothetical protein EV44_g1986 [Erysiphe necator]|uniref:Uncharacterized protein n=1 Tax=Uncinula necator TaxID=52586 RepID=A0A0B1P7B0_UNCNE|nr:hypothetical protein EV44_g1986 [Erysiphe necator]
MDDPSNSSEFGDADMEDPSGKAQSEATETVAGEENEKTKIEARGIDVGSQSERLGGRNYIDANSWTA